MVGFMSFSSGSCGNCYFLHFEDEKGVRHGMVIDAGVSVKRLKQGLIHCGLDLDSFSSVLITHDHMDHIRHLGSFCKRLCKPVYATSVLHRALSYHSVVGKHILDCRRLLKDGEWNEIDGFKVKSFVVPHDATQTVGYAIFAGSHKFVIMTDLGRITQEAIDFASEADTVVVESNYDMDMLISGSYTHELKMRICQGNGHLSNDECALAIKQFWHKGLRNIFLCHLSENNNTPELAYKTARAALDSIGVGIGEVNMQPLPRTDQSQYFIL